MQEGVTKAIPRKWERLRFLFPWVRRRQMTTLRIVRAIIRRQSARSLRSASSKCPFNSADVIRV